MFDIFGDTFDAYSGDKGLMASLGLRTWGFKHEWTDLGTVVVEEADTENEYNCPTGPRPAATVKVEVSAMPAQFWCFTVTRPRDEVKHLDDGSWHSVYEPVERFEVKTGSGSFSEYWPMAKALAQHTLTVQRIEN